MSQELEAQEMLDELDLGSARGRHAQLDFEIEVVRSLTEDDIPAILAPSSLPALPGQRIQEIRYAHHQIARLLTQGHRQVEISAITGYSPSYVSHLKSDPLFQELLAYYQSNSELQSADVYERMRSLAIESMEELQKRLSEEPDRWTRRELMELAELMAVKPLQAKFAAAPPTAGGVSIGITFVQPTAAATVSSIDIDATDVVVEG